MRTVPEATLALFATVSLLLAFGVTPVAGASSTGYRGHSYAGYGAESAGGAITGQKPESKLWFHDGAWWAAMLSPGAGGAHTIHRLDGTVWTDTGVAIDTRPTTKEDVLAVGDRVYILSRAASTSDVNRLRRFSYSSVSGTYRLDAGFPVVVPGAGAEAVTVARDSTGVLWIAFEHAKRIRVARTNGTDTTWSAPYVVPVAGATGTSYDDIAAVLSFRDAHGPAIGVMWSNQSHDAQYFAIHRDGAPDSAWTVETALSGPNEADDHLNVKTADGRVYAVVKTSASTSSQPLIRLLVRDVDGRWSKHPVAKREERTTRPITMLEIDVDRREIYVFMTDGEGAGADGIVYKRSSMSGIGFPAEWTVFIRDAGGKPINNATSSKQNASIASGIVVLASDGSHYWHNAIGGTGGGGGPVPVNSAPLADGVSVSVGSGSSVSVGLSGSDVETCELRFSVVSGPSHGSVGPVSNEACVAGNPNRDRAGVVYTPGSEFVGDDQFTYEVSDGELTATATVSVTVTEASSGGSGAIAFRASSSGANQEEPQLVLPRPSGVQTGDVLVASVDVRGSPGISAPQGWNRVRLDDHGYVLRKALFVKVAGSSEPSSYTWTLSAAKSAAGVVLAYSGVDTTTPVLSHAGQVNDRSSSLTAAGVSTDVAGSMLVVGFATAPDASLSPAAGMTERAEISALNRYPVTSQASDEPLSSTGTTGTRTATASRIVYSIAHTLALRPAA